MNLQDWYVSLYKLLYVLPVYSSRNLWNESMKCTKDSTFSNLNNKIISSFIAETFFRSFRYNMTS